MAAGEPETVEPALGSHSNHEEYKRGQASLIPAVRKQQEGTKHRAIPPCVYNWVFWAVAEPLSCNHTRTSQLNLRC